MGELFAGRYELVDPLGYGGMGAVWRCWDHKISGYVAAKLLRHVDATSLLRFVREQAFRIDHPHLVTPLSWAAEDDRVLYTMPLVRGGSVATLRNDFGALPYRWVAVFVDQLLDALSAVHQAGIVHRDLKPANLLLEPTGQARPHLRLSDFGIAAAVGEPRLTGPSHIVGTPGYVAPEQMRGASPEPRQDLYAVGVVAADLLLGRTESTESPVASSVSGPPPDGVPPAFWSLLGHLTRERADDRPANAAAARSELTAAACVPDSWAAPAVVGQQGEPVDDVEVFDHHPALPPGWGAHGPSTGSAAFVGPDAARVGPVGAAVSPPGTAASQMGTAAGPRTTVQPAEHHDARATVFWSENRPADPAGGARSTSPRARRVVRALAWIATAAGVGMLVSGVALLLR